MLLHFPSFFCLSCAPPPRAGSLHLVTPGCVRVCASLVRPFPALGFRLQAAVLIHRVGGSALGGLSLVWGVWAETSGSIAPTWGVSLGGCCLGSTCAVGTNWRFSRPFGTAMIYTAYVEILYLNIFYTGGTMRYIFFTPTPHLGALGSSIVFLCPARGIVGSHSCLSSTCTTHGPCFVGTRVKIDGTYPAHIFLIGV